MKKFVVFMFLLLAIPSAFSHAQEFNSFIDIEGNVHAENIVELNHRGIVDGYADGSFKPDQKINRAEFLKILTETKGDYSPSRDPSGYDIEAPVGINLTDIMEKAWFIPYVRHALQNEIVGGYPDGTFQPTRNVNLAEALKMIFKTFNIPTVQFIRAPDNWYDYYTTSLEGDFEAETHLDRETDIGKEITRGEMASLILYLEMRAPEKNL